MKRISVLAATAGLCGCVQAQAQTVLTVSSWVPPAFDLAGSGRVVR